VAYKRTNWKDRVVEKPHTYTETDNGDGTNTYTEAPGEVITQGTPLSATNFNNIEENLLHLSVAFDWLYCVSQAQIRALNDRVEALEAATAELTT
jgi:hypothetical protein